MPRLRSSELIEKVRRIAKDLEGESNYILGSICRIVEETAIQNKELNILLLSEKKKTFQLENQLSELRNKLESPDIHIKQHKFIFNPINRLVYFTVRFSWFGDDISASFNEDLDNLLAKELIGGNINE